MGGPAGRRPVTQRRFCRCLYASPSLLNSASAAAFSSTLPCTLSGWQSRASSRYFSLSASLDARVSGPRPRVRMACLSCGESGPAMLTAHSRSEGMEDPTQPARGSLARALTQGGDAGGLNSADTQV